MILTWIKVSDLGNLKSPISKLRQTKMNYVKAIKELLSETKNGYKITTISSYNIVLLKDLSPQNRKMGSLMPAMMLSCQGNGFEIGLVLKDKEINDSI